MKIKGSEVGFSLAKIKRILMLKQQLVIANNVDKQKPILNNDSRNIHDDLFTREYNTRRQPQANHKAYQIQKELNGLLHQLLKPEEIQQNIHAELLHHQKKKKKNSELGIKHFNDQNKNLNRSKNKIKKRTWKWSLNSFPKTSEQMLTR